MAIDLARKFFCLLCLCFLGGAAGCSEKGSPTITIAAASNLAPALDELVATFEEQSGVSCSVLYASSGKLTTQLLAGAPYDLFLSANSAYPDTLRANNIGLGELIVFAKGRLALWALDTSYQLSYLPELALPSQDNRRRYALANPRTAPYGTATQELLQNTNLWQAIQPQLVYGQSAGQTAQFVQTGNVDAGYVPLSIILGQPKEQRGNHQLVPSYLHRPIAQTALRTTNNKAAEAFLNYLKTSEAREILDKFGYE